MFLWFISPYFYKESENNKFFSRKNYLKSYSTLKLFFSFFNTEETQTQSWITLKKIIDKTVIILGYFVKKYYEKVHYNIKNWTFPPSSTTCCKGLENALQELRILSHYFLGILSQVFVSFFFSASKLMWFSYIKWSLIIVSCTETLFFNPSLYHCDMINNIVLLGIVVFCISCANKFLPNSSTNSLHIIFILQQEQRHNWKGLCIR